MGTGMIWIIFIGIAGVTVQATAEGRFLSKGMAIR